MSREPTGWAGTTVPAELDADAAGRPTRFSDLNSYPALDDRLLKRLTEACASVDTGDAARVRAGRDWWPMSVVWAAAGNNPSLPAAVVRPSDTSEVSAVLRVCNDARVPVVPVAGRSGVCGGSIPVFGGVSIDLTAMTGITAVDDTSLLVDVRAGTNGETFESELRSAHGLTAGHWPQSIALSTVGGWVACRGAGQYSTRYGKVEDMVAGLEVVLANGTVVHTGGRAPRSATGPDLTQLFVGSEGTLGVITGARFKTHPAPEAERRAVYGFASFESGLEACRLVMRRGATPAVLRLFDVAESHRTFEAEGVAVLVVIDEGDASLVDAVMTVVDDVATDSRFAASRMSDTIAARWLEHRNNVPPVESLVRAGIVGETVEIAGSWAALPRIYEDAIRALNELDGTLAASARQSHAYVDGACLYFTFAGRPDDGLERYYRRCVDAIVGSTARHGGSISHHHGVGINRVPYIRDELGSAHGVLSAIKSALDPNGIMNPGKLGLDSPFGDLRKEWA